ncbi:MAG: M61 family metallopeptidase [Sphingomonadaceae bacterium]|nr:M61 family metallopeptidase [Sphingomonadaceae bacterium]
MTRTLAAVLALALPAAALAQQATAPTGTSKPQPVAIVDAIPSAKDVPYPGTIELAVDATDTARGVFHIRENVPVTPGPLTLLYPAWLPGAHAPQGQTDKIAGLTITVGGQPLPWRRDTVDVHAFHVDIPGHVADIDVAFDFVSPTAPDQGPVVVTPNILALEWISTVLYPAGYFARQIMVAPSATYPAGWASATALPTSDNADRGGTVHYAPVALDTLADSPVFAGRFVRREPLSPDVTLNFFADRADELKPTEAQLAAHRALATQAVRLFGAQHYSHYDFLFALSDRIDGFGLEHHRSSEDQASPDYFLSWDDNVASRDLLGHEFTHSWNGKFRRPADLWTPDFRVPMQNSLLWVYEGQTQFWGNILSARSGLIPAPEMRDRIAQVAAYYTAQAGRAWRPLLDTTNEEILSNRRPEPYTSWQRAEDYYNEGMLIWLDADSLIRERSHGKRGLDDFARAFFGVRDRDWGELTYTRDDVIAALNAVEPYDWAGFLHARVDLAGVPAPLDGITRGGYRLVFTDQPGKLWKSRETSREVMDLSYSLGLVVGKHGAVKNVLWGSPADKAGITVGATLVAIDGAKYDDDVLKQVVTAAKDGTAPIRLLIEANDTYRTVDVAWNGGLRYPHLERTGKGPSSLDALLTAR